MKKAILSLLLLGCGSFAFAQTRVDYDAAVSRFQHFYNLNQTDSIYGMMSERAHKMLSLDRTKLVFKQVHQYGDLKSYEYMRSDNGLYYYKSVFETTVLTFLVGLDKDNKLETFRLLPYAADTTASNYNITTDKGGRLYGTLTLPLPPTNKKVPVVLLIAGSGPTDRDGNSTMGVSANTYKMIADSLQHAGIACVRFDKRGVAASAAALDNESGLRFEDMVSDAEGYIKKMREDSRFSKVYILGHSEGSLVGMLAAEKEHVAGYISVSGIAERADKIMELQIKAQSEEVAAKATVLLDSIRNGYTVENVPEELAALLHKSVQPYLRSWLKYVPGEEIKKVKEPILILQGTTDIQVEVAQAELLKKASPHAKLTIIKGMNHILKTAPADRQENMATYKDPALPLSTGLMGAIVGFVH